MDSTTVTALYAAVLDEESFHGSSGVIHPYQHAEVECGDWWEDPADRAAEDAWERYARA